MVLFNNNSLSVHSTGNSNVQKQTIAELHYKDACDFATTSSDNLTSGYTESHANQTITKDAVGVVTIDGQTLALGNRILVKNQTDTKENGIYKVTTLGSGSAKLILTRAGDFNSSTECPAGGVTFVIVSKGTENANKSFIIGASESPAETSFGNTTFSVSTGAAAASEITVADESSDTTCFPIFATGATGNLAPKTNALKLTFNSNSGELTSTSFVGALTGNVTGNASGSSGSCTGNANTATTATNITVADDESSDEECFPVFTTDKSGNKPPKTKTTLTFNTSTDALTVGGGVIVGTNGSTAGDVVIDNTNNGEIIWEGSTADGNENKLRAADGAGVNTLPASTGTILTTAAAVSVANGGTGATSASGALSNLGLNATAAEINILDETAASSSTLSTPQSADGVLTYDASANTISWKTLASVCFLKGTKITLSNHEQKPIEDLKLGEQVLTYHIEGLSNLRKKEKVKIMNWSQDSMEGYFKNSKVRNIWVNPADQYLILNEKLKLTNKHIIHVKRDNEFKFLPAENARIGDELLTDREHYEEIHTIEQKDEKVEVYNIEVSRNRTYFADNYLVHHFCETCSGFAERI